MFGDIPSIVITSEQLLILVLLSLIAVAAIAAWRFVVSAWRVAVLLACVGLVGGIGLWFILT